MGYYTQVAGLGASPNDVTVNGTIDAYNQCFGPNDCTALVAVVPEPAVHDARDDSRVA